MGVPAPVNSRVVNGWWEKLRAVVAKLAKAVARCGVGSSTEWASGGRASLGAWGVRARGGARLRGEANGLGRRGLAALGSSWRMEDWRRRHWWAEQAHGGKDSLGIERAGLQACEIPFAGRTDWRRRLACCRCRAVDWGAELGPCAAMAWQREVAGEWALVGWRG
ncbi:unnamed protein product [Miscanthus lutarioriparius]|uniref:Uncharacterized protein n=1 Tax=Miscanthus lutarioriparius TaxID=422564 RepID=A0A811P7U5_9POAL|nr:unnamed protein product [Miscanthus lutarioriparius]